MLTQRHGVRLLGPGDVTDFLELTGRDPVVNVFADFRARTTQLQSRWLGGEVWGRYDRDRLVAACHVGANLVPVECTAEDAEAFAAKALTRRRTVSTLVGPQEPIAALWAHLEPRWGPARDVRLGQPHLQIDTAPSVAPDPAVRVTRVEDLEVLYPACVAMHLEELGDSPEQDGGGDLYRARVRQLVSRGWSFSRIEDGEVLFKAEVAWASPYAAQIQGVYVAPRHRGRGLASHGMAAVVELVRAEVAPIVSLYVNDWNLAARRAYATTGFRETARFSTIMF